eukprot:5871288-Pleurochrysis_carterae.AAC.5
MQKQELRSECMCNTSSSPDDLRPVNHLPLYAHVTIVSSLFSLQSPHFNEQSKGIVSGRADTNRACLLAPLQNGVKNPSALAYVPDEPAIY